MPLNLTQRFEAAGFPVTGDALQTAPLPFMAGVDNQALLLIEGVDTLRFLQGQITCDIQQLKPLETRLGAACTPKGRVYMNFRALQLSEQRVILRLAADRLDGVLNHLKKYAAFFKVQMRPLADWAILGFAMKQSTTNQQTNSSPLQDGRCLTGKTALPIADGYLIPVPAAVDADVRCEWWGPATAIASLRTDLNPAVQPVAPANWRLSEIRAGLANINQALTDVYVPQMLNLHLLDAISFKKGCYTGQEIVARMHYLGQLKKSLFRLSLRTGNCLNPLDAIHLDGKSVGQLLETVTLGDTTEALAVINHAAIDASPALPLQLADGTPAQLLPLPLSVAS